MADALALDPKRTALVLIDLQGGILGRQTAPHAARDVLARSVRLAERFRSTGGLVVLVRVSFSPDGGDRLTPPTDDPPPPAATQPGWDEISPALGRDAKDIVITKRQWGASMELSWIFSFAAGESAPS